MKAHPKFRLLKFQKPHQTAALPAPGTPAGNVGERWVQYYLRAPDAVAAAERYLAVVIKNRGGA